MIVAQCPLRISLVGGSTDLDSFINEYGRGEVVGFPCNLYTSIILQQDKAGCNSDGYYVINYSRKEIESNIVNIENNLVREALEYFRTTPLGITFYSDIHSDGSGLAASSSYMNCLVKALAIYTNGDIDVQHIAHMIEKRFNPLLGQQDSYGCGVGGLKHMKFFKDRQPEMFWVADGIFDSMNIFLVPTEVYRQSTDILKTIKFQNDSLLHLVQAMVNAIISHDTVSFHEIIQEGWQKKKETSAKITENPAIKKLDAQLSQDSRILSHKLCGAGNGGYFLVFANSNNIPYNATPIKIENEGVTANDLRRQI